MCFVLNWLSKVLEAIFTDVINQYKVKNINLKLLICLFNYVEKKNKSYVLVTFFYIFLSMFMINKLSITFGHKRLSSKLSWMLSFKESFKR